MIERTARVLNVGVIGGGLAGLAAACTLAARGHNVTLLEKNEWVGGKAAVLHQDGFRFDMGPTILTLPSVLHSIFREANRNLEDYMHLVALDPQWRCFFQDGGVLDLVPDLAKMKANLERFSPVPNIGQGYERFMQISKRLHDVSPSEFGCAIRKTAPGPAVYSPNRDHNSLASTAEIASSAKLAGPVMPSRRRSQPPSDAITLRRTFSP